MFFPAVHFHPSPIFVSKGLEGRIHKSSYDNLTNVLRGGGAFAKRGCFEKASSLYL